MSVKFILLVLEDNVFRAESIDYATNLAKRIDCSVSVLMLIDNPDDENSQLDSEQGVMDIILKMLNTSSVNAQGTIRHGDKASGLIKHLAAYSSFDAIIWGGKEEIVSKRNLKKPDHWLAKVRSTIRCPIVSPTKKDQDQRET
jgi:hypothetical protein